MERIIPKSTRYQALDAWRGVVCVIVVLEHAAVCLWNSETSLSGGWVTAQAWLLWLSRLNLGAPLFFVISGYCIASSLDSSRRKGVPPSRFLARRLWRIFPPYWASVLAIALLVVALDRAGLAWLHSGGVGLELYSPFSLDRLQWLGNVTLTETWRPRVTGEPTLLLNRVAWALCYQEQFYLVCFLALVTFPRRLHGALAVATLAIVGGQLMLWDSGRDHLTAGALTDLWHEFAIGLALYWRLNVASTAAERRLVELGMAGVCVLGWWQGMVSTAASAGFGLLLIACYRWDDAVAKVRRLDGLRACGRRSYAVYLIHLPVCTVGNAFLAEAVGIEGFYTRLLVMVPAVTAASVAVGWAFHHLVDRKFTSLPTWGAPRPGAAPAPVVDPAPPTLVVLNSWPGSDLEKSGAIRAAGLIRP